MYRMADQVLVSSDIEYVRNQQINIWVRFREKGPNQTSKN